MEHRYYKLQYNGEGLDLFKIKLVNIILTVATLGFYYPWAKARTLSYLYSQTHFEDSPFSFTGTGKEMFKGFIKAILILIAFYGLSLFAVYSGSKELIRFLVLGFYLLMLIMMPLI